MCALVFAALLPPSAGKTLRPDDDDALDRRGRSDRCIADVRRARSAEGSGDRDPAADFRGVWKDPLSTIVQ